VTQALYAHMNKTIKKEKKNNETNAKKKRNAQSTSKK
jgi:hypothetical protein